MHRFARMGQLGIAFLWLFAVAAWAEQDDPSSNPYQGQGLYQPIPGNASSGNLIGYKPIPPSAFDAALPSVIPAQPAATPAYPVPVARGGVRRGAKTLGASPSATGSTELPSGYLTGIVGEGFYTLGRDDIIRIVVRNQPEFSGDFVIGFDGRIQYNYLGDIPVAGLTKYEVQQVLETLLRQYIRVPDVTVMVMAYNSKVVYVIGEVNAPGKFVMRGDAIKLREAILAAGLPTTRAALSRVHVIKPDLEQPIVRVINVKRILYQGKLKDDVQLSAGEIVVVPSTVMSKVNGFLATLLSPVTQAASVAWLAAL
ncbi:MAG: polysaccharide export protein [Candidatus Omnitrophica bacterium]|nr:polysaccharide export protein [Candidatus Omnitrophota bacterium]